MAKINNNASQSIIISLFISMLVGGLFGFLSALAVNSNLKSNIEQELISGEFAQRAEENLKEIQKKQRLAMNEEESNVTTLVENVSPAVVSIIITKDVPVIERYYENPFGVPGFGIPRERQRGFEEQEVGGGTGFLVSEEGIIVTNRHVVEDTEADYTVLTNNESKYSATVLGRDPINDIAIIKINPEEPTEGEGFDEVPFVELGDSNDLLKGQTVVAIGNALGEYTNTVSKGIVSGLRRNIIAGDSMGNTESLSELIQTDAAVNQGNSGGPLLNLAGEVIGVNVAMSQRAENIGFAIPINDIKPIIQSIKEEGKIIRPYLGIRYIINNDSFAEANNLPYDYGALVISGESSEELAVIPGSPADEAGIERNDLILEIDGEEININNTPGNAISDNRPGETVELKIYRDGETIERELVLGEREGM